MLGPLGVETHSVDLWRHCHIGKSSDIQMYQFRPDFGVQMELIANGLGFNLTIDFGSKRYYK